MNTALCADTPRPPSHSASKGRRRLLETIPSRWWPAAEQYGSARSSSPARLSCGPRILFSVHVRFDYAWKPLNQNSRKLDEVKKNCSPGLVTLLPALSSRPTSRDPAEGETEREWRAPENASSATLIRRVLPKLQVVCYTHATRLARAGATQFATSSGSTFSVRSRENALGDSYSVEFPESVTRRAHPRDLSTPPQSPALRDSFVGRDDRSSSTLPQRFNLLLINSQMRNVTSS